MRSRAPRAVLVLVSIAVLAAGCGGDDGGDDAVSATSTGAGTAARTAQTADSSRTAPSGTASASPTATTATADVSSTPTATGSSDTATPTATPTEPAAATATPTAESDDRAEFAELVGRAEARPYAVVYDVTIAGDDSQGGEWTFAQDPPRSAVVLDFEGGGRVMFIEDGSVNHICFEGGGFGQCLESDPSEPSPVPPGANPNAVGAEASVADGLREVEGRTIAGREARCFAYEGSAPGTMCVETSTGIPLAIESQEVTMIAKAVSESPSPELFELPHDVAEG